MLTYLTHELSEARLIETTRTFIFGRKFTIFRTVWSTSSLYNSSLSMVRQSLFQSLDPRTCPLSISFCGVIYNVLLLERNLSQLYESLIQKYRAISRQTFAKRTLKDWKQALLLSLKERFVNWIVFRFGLMHGKLLSQMYLCWVPLKNIF